MKKLLIVLIFVFINFIGFSQITYEKGYFLTNNNQKIECLIKNIDWKNNPTEIDYKLKEQSEKLIFAIDSIKEFEIYNNSKYIRQEVDIDRSSKTLGELSEERRPDFNKEILFLKVLIEGESNLYQYEDKNLVRFFYKKNNSEVIEQLVYKLFLSTPTKTSENKHFIQQIYNNLKCDDIKFENLKKLDYRKSDLVSVFVKYNSCIGENIVNYTKMKKNDLFNLTARIGINMSSLDFSIESNIINQRSYGNKINLRLGLETEFILPFNNGKWSLILEPTYQSYNGEEEVGNLTSKVNYKSIEVPIGARYYFFLNQDSKLFINAAYVLDFVMDSSLDQLEFSNSTNLGFGLGYKQNDKFSLEFRYHTSRELLNSFNSFETDYKTVSLIFGYSFL